MGQRQLFGVNHFFCSCDLTLMGHQEPRGNVDSQRRNKCWIPGTFSFLANELTSVPKVVK